LKKALLIIDRGSREADVKEELQDICSIVKRKGEYDYADYCFLEVLPPFIEEGIKKCVENGAEFITIMPYFLYPGMKLKESVKKSAKIGRIRNLKLVIAKPLSYHSMMAELVIDRINQLKKEEKIRHPNSECDILVIGHGSSDKNARDALVYIINRLKPFYRRVAFCFLELDTPSIDEGIRNMIEYNPKIILLLPYFLHKGAHIKRDVIDDVNSALKKYSFKNVFMAKHLGVDEKLVDLVLELSREAEQKIVF
jgi:sirohydrochlorin ferrochelatase